MNQVKRTRLNVCKINHFKIKPILLATLLSLYAGLAGAGPVSQLCAQFDAETKLLDKPFSALNSKYRAYLEAQKTTYQQAGNLKGRLAVDEELKGFENGATQPNLVFSEVKRLEEIYQSQKTELGQKKQAPYFNLVRNYRKKTEERASEFTQSGWIEEALFAMAEAERFVAMEKAAPAVSYAPPMAPVPASGASAWTNFQGMILDPAWLPERLGVAQRHTGELRYYSRLVLGNETKGNKTALDVICGNLKWLMPIDKASESFGSVTKKPSVKIIHPSYPPHSLTMHGLQGRFQDGGYLFSEVFLLADAKGQLISVHYVAHAPKVKAWVPGIPGVLRGKTQGGKDTTLSR